ncbi:DNA-3-methyladenine glycosylase I [Tissierella praeacuta]|uniref:DNA-3-methyladenine glycosylase I n=1 Tax=Tissierella praeacuta TaxID=43131 RepID=UPI001C0F576E|nr:DNA-3-methyladenine glycosylase I [Tissierella praeacuta]MBU5257088.1 DNA-3-methyladenine glycosylase I [Tissierella praeacuta]
MEVKRCSWAKKDVDIVYHDNEWGKPVHDDNLLFEILILEGMQAGLSWTTILNKRESMRIAFDGFNPQIIAEYSTEKKEELLLNPSIIRNKAKINALVTNAKAFLRIQEEYGSFNNYIWKFVDNHPIVNKWTDLSQVPVNTEISERISKDLYARGFKFIGSTICYAFMQAVGMVNDHMVWCEQYSKS